MLIAVIADYQLDLKCIACLVLNQGISKTINLVNKMSVFEGLNQSSLRNILMFVICVIL